MEGKEREGWLPGLGARDLGPQLAFCPLHRTLLLKFKEKKRKEEKRRKREEKRGEENRGEERRSEELEEKRGEEKRREEINQARFSVLRTEQRDRRCDRCG